MNTRRKLIWQIYPSYLIIIVIALSTMLIYTSTSLKQFYLQRVEQQLESHARLFQTLLTEQVMTDDLKRVLASSAGASHEAFRNNFPELNALCETVGQAFETRISLILSSGQVIGDSMENPANMDNHANRPEIRAALSGQIGVSTRYSCTLDKDMMYVSIPVKHENQIWGVVRASTSVTTIQQILNVLSKKIVSGGLLVSLFAAIISFAVSYRINRPLEEIRQGAVRFANGDLSHRLYVSGSQEISTLAEAMNRMASQLDERIETVTRQHSELEAVLSSMIEAVIVVDQEEHIVRCNHAAGRLFGFHGATVAQRHIQEVIRNVNIHRFVKTTLANHAPVEEVIVLHTGNERFLRAHGTLLRVAEGRMTGVLLVFHDITRLKELENMRRDFVANVSHELKTPITSINGFVETLQDGAINDPENASRFLGIIARNAKRLNSIIEDLLALSKIEQEEGKGQLLLRRDNITHVLETAAAACEKKAQEKGIRIEVSSDAPLMANMNADLLEQAVINLLDNAIKYSNPQGRISVQAAQAEEEIVITVKDSGCGIPAEHLPRLFERFYRVDKARSRKLGGTGLGLAIVKHIVQAHSGTVAVESLPGKGSLFTIKLPSVDTGEKNIPGFQPQRGKMFVE